ncbi:maleylpyruvate isomerase family mycothiol-dependent enzyme [Actinokineospora sp. HUAS TT18]|uniref:maleylpyruvate isomerase family mycothiol-dependent enzyme n=1 Tax=Actinokineospora sp. HUAS TT18 TaxID=3447451 RepID=UPI003F51D3B9
MDFAAELITQNRLLAEAVRGADPTAEVPTCPGWTLRQLVTHVGRGNRWAAQISREQLQAPLDPKTVDGGKAPENWDAAVDWLVDSVEVLVESVNASGEAPVWTFTGPQPSTWWLRRRLHEVVVHRADAVLAIGEKFEVDPVVAADSISEWLFLVATRGKGVLAEGTSLHLHATDADGEWLVKADGDKIVWEQAHGKATAAAKGATADLLLTLLRRAPLDGRLEIHGDADVLQHWLDHTPF